MPNSKISRTTPETQANFDWTPPTGTLGSLTNAAWERARTLELHTGTGSAPELDAFRPPSLEAALRRDTVAVIAEIKRSSPSKGEINPKIDAAGQARRYAEGGAAALSILTEPTRFGGSNSDITAARAVGLPILKKDFHVTESQLEEAKSLGASAALIIVRAIEPFRLAPLAEAARSLALEIIFEVRNENELARALDAGARIIGVNNRDLETLEIDVTTVGNIIPRVPRDCVAIAESGYSTVEDVEKAAAAGADAVLIGSALSASQDPRGLVSQLSRIPRNRTRR